MAVLSEWGLSVRNEQLVGPSSDFALSMFSTCLEQVTSLPPNALRESVQNSFTFLGDPNAVRPRVYSCGTIVLTVR